MTGGPLHPVATFDVTAALPTGTTLLEASAGTGKTYAIAALATRYLAEGHATIDQLLMITFGRAATRELRERVRASLTEGRDVLRQAVRRPSAPPPDDPVLAMLAGLPPTERAAAADRLAAAVAGFDAATIATTHQFCLHALAGLGIAADTDPAAEFVEDITALIDETVADLYLRKYGRDTGTGPPVVADLALPDARRIARAVVGDPQSALVPAADDGSADATRVRFAEAVAGEVARRRRARHLVTYDDLVLRLADALTDPVTGDQACRRLRQAYQVVLVDEFQDTDPAQWRILSAAFHGHRALILVGDPKQAIYAFRGADVMSYLAASDAATLRATLATNHRSDAPVVDALGELLGGLSLGDPRITVHPVTAARIPSRLSGMSGTARVRLRIVPSVDGVPPRAPEARAQVAADVAGDIVALLSGGARIQDPTDQVMSDATAGDATAADSPERPLRPRDIAVLVPRNMHGEQLHEALARVGVPSVISAPTSVFATAAATQWRTLLAALDAPRRGTIRAAALTDFVGRSSLDLALAGDTVDDEVSGQLRDWEAVLAATGPAGLMSAVSTQTALLPRVLSRPDGERQLTDLRHVAGALHTHQRRTRCGVTGLLDWLDDEIDRAADDPVEQTADQTRRLETDAEAVQILTIHRSKGLQFPVVYVPFGWDRHVRAPLLVRCHDRGRRVLDVRTQSTPGRGDLVALQQAEEDGESLRLLYVALTRAASAVVMHWAGGRNAEAAPLTRVLAARAARLSEPPGSASGSVPQVGWLSDSRWIAVETVPDRPAGHRWTAPRPATPQLEAAPFTRSIDVGWRRTSYSGLTAGLHETTPESAPAGHRDDEPADDTAAGTDLDRNGPGQAPPSPAVTGTMPDSAFAALPGGTSFGTLVHAALEQVDPAATDLAGEVALRCAEAQRVHPVPGVDGGVLAAALEAALRTPLGPLAAGRTLADIPATDRLTELGFELPLGHPVRPGRVGAHDGEPVGADPSVADPCVAERDGAEPGAAAGTRPGANLVEASGAGAHVAGAPRPATVADIARLLTRHLPHGDPLRSYPARLLEAGIGDSVLRGFLTGSVDAVLRVTAPRPAVRGTTESAGRGTADAYHGRTARRDAIDAPALPPRPARSPGQQSATRFLVVDYKTNRIRPPGPDPDAGSVWDYRPSALADVMMTAHYPLQAVLYSAALHRYLRWRLPGYDPDSHLGGVLYLFLRGMAGPDTPTEAGLPCGVFSWHPPSALVVELSDLLDGRRP